MNDTSNKFKGNLDIINWTELENHAVVEEWTWSNCYEKDYYTQVEASSPTFQTFGRKEIARWVNDPNHYEYEWNLNKFLLDNGLELLPGRVEVNTDPPKGYSAQEPPFEVNMIKEGEGDLITDSDVVYIHYRGQL